MHKAIRAPVFRVECSSTRRVAAAIPRCGPCLAIAPVIDRLAEEYAGRLKIVKLNVDENIEISGRYGIRGIPTLVLFNRGQEVDRHVGVPSNALNSISQMIEKQLA